MSFCTNCGKPLAALGMRCLHCNPRTSPLGLSAARGAPSHSGTQQTLTVSASARIAIGQTLFVVSPNLAADIQRGLEKSIVKPLGFLTANDPSIVQEKVRQLAKQLHTTNELKFICLIGDWYQIPPYRVENPSQQCAINDPFCITDALFGCLEVWSPHDIFTAIPVVPVGRIPSNDSQVILKILLEAPVTADPAKAFAFGVSAENWAEATQAIVNQFTASASKSKIISGPAESTLASSGILSSPEWEEDDLRTELNSTALSAGSVLLFNVHGSPDEPVWVGDGDLGYPEIFRNDTIQAFNQSILLTEACYGGALGYDEPSIVESFFSHGGKAFIGCSVIAWGSVNASLTGASNQNLCGADLIALHFFKALQKGKNFGEALTAAKLATIAGNAFDDQIAQKTVLSFNLFGAPWHALKSTSSLYSPPQVSQTSGSMLDRVRSRRSADNSDGEDSLQSLRQSYRQRLPAPTQWFLMDSQEALARLNQSRDKSKIDGFLNTMEVSFDECDFETMMIDDDVFFRIVGKSTKHPKTMQQFMLVMNHAGHLTQTLTTKG
jgi:hypothetical protein